MWGEAISLFFVARPYFTDGLRSVSQPTSASLYCSLKVACDCWFWCQFCCQDGCRIRENGAGCCHCSLAFSPRSSPLVLFTTYRDFSLQIVGVATTTASCY